MKSSYVFKDVIWDESFVFVFTKFSMYSFGMLLFGVMSLTMKNAGHILDLALVKFNF